LLKKGTFWLKCNKHDKGTFLIENTEGKFALELKEIRQGTN
jgi:hypothetical protein